MSQLLFLNPHKRGSKAKRAKVRKVAKRRKSSARKIFSNPAPAPKRSKARRVKARTVRTVYRNPLPKAKTIVNGQIIPAVHGALGAVSLSAINGMVIDKLPISAEMKAGPMRDVLKAVGAIGIGILANKVAKGQTANNVAIGAMTMVMTDALRRQVIKFLPSVKLAGLEDELFSPLGFITQNGLSGDDPMLGMITQSGLSGDDPMMTGAQNYDPLMGQYV